MLLLIYSKRKSLFYLQQATLFGDFPNKGIVSIDFQGAMG